MIFFGHVSLLKGNFFLVMVMVEIQDEAAPSGASHESALEDLLSGIPMRRRAGGFPVTHGVITYNPYK